MRALIVTVPAKATPQTRPENRADINGGVLFSHEAKTQSWCPEI